MRDSNSEISEIIVRKDEESDNSHRESFNREEDAILLPVVSRQIGILSGNNTIEKDGKLVGKRDIFLSSIPIKPLALGNKKGNSSKKKKKYKEYLDRFFKKNEDEIVKFKDKEELLVYLCFFLRERKFLNSDIDNYVKPILDSLKCFIGDDSKIVSLFIEKKGLIGGDLADLDFYEQSIIFISTPDAKEDLFKTPKYCFDFLGLLNSTKEINFKGRLKISKK